MVKLIQNDNLFDSRCQTLVNTVNCVGVMGKGIALEFKRRYPAMFEVYRRICQQGLLEVGKLQLWKGTDHWVLNFPTKQHWRNPSQTEWIESGLKKFADTYRQKGITSIAFLMLGCRNGGLDKDVVLPLMLRYLERCEGLEVEVYV